MRHLCQSVDDYPQLVAFVREWQFCDKVHCDGLPVGVREFQAREKPVRLVPCRLVLLAFRAASYEVDNSFVHLWPPEVPSNELDRLVLAHVASNFRVVF